MLPHSSHTREPGVCKCQWSLSLKFATRPPPHPPAETESWSPNRWEYHWMNMQQTAAPLWKGLGKKHRIPPTRRKLSRAIFCKQSLPRTPPPGFLLGPQPLTPERKLRQRGQGKCCPRQGGDRWGDQARQAHRPPTTPPGGI